MGHSQRRAEELLGAGHVQEGFVDAVLLHIGRIILQNRDHRLALLHVKVEVRRHHLDARVLGAGGKQAFAGFDAVFLGGAALGQHDAMALGFVAAHHRRDGAQVHVLAVPQMLDGRPRQKRRVDIHMEKDFGHGRLLSRL